MGSHTVGRWGHRPHWSPHALCALLPSLLARVAFPQSPESRSWLGCHRRPSVVDELETNGLETVVAFSMLKQTGGIGPLGHRVTR